MNRFFLTSVAAAGLALLAGAPAFAAPDAPPALDLAGAMARARQQALEVAAARARGSAAAEDLIRARGSRLPQVRLSESWIRTDSPAEAFALQLNQERFSFQDFVTSDPNRPATLETAISRVEVELPIWTGGEISARVKQARHAAEAADATTRSVEDNAALAAAEAWVGLAQAREYVALLERSRATVAAHVDLARAYSAQGMLVRSELLRAEVELARMDDLLAAARGRARVAQANLAFRLGDPGDSDYDLATLPDPPPLQGDIAAWLARADGRPDLAAARGQLAAGELEARALNARRLPRIGVLARHDWTDDQLFGGHGEATSIYAGVTFDLFDGGNKRAAVAAARARAEAGKQDVARLEAGIGLEVRQAWEATRAALERHATDRSALDAAAETVRIVEERFRSGVVKTLDVLDAATARREAETRELVARADANLAELRLAVAAGAPPESALATTAATGADPNSPSSTTP
jgi:outer membrane protein